MTSGSPTPTTATSGLEDPRWGAGTGDAPVDAQGAAEPLPPRVKAAMDRREFRDLLDRSSVARHYDPFGVLIEDDDLPWVFPRCRWWLTWTERCTEDAGMDEPFCWQHGERFSTVVPFAEVTFGVPVSGGGEQP